MYKIVKEIHTYQQNKVKFRVYEKLLWIWIPCFDFLEFENFELAENAIIEELNGRHGGIIEVDNNIYKFHPYCLPTI